MKKYHNITKIGATSRLFSLFRIGKGSVSSAKLDGYNGKSFEKTMRLFWKQVAGFSSEWRDGWDESFMPGAMPFKDGKAVTFVMSITAAEGEIERGCLYMLLDTRHNRLTAVGFIDQNDGYTQEYTAEQIQNALRVAFDDYN